MKLLMRKLVLALVALGATTLGGQSTAAEFSAGPRGVGVLIEGEIKPGDFYRLAMFVMNANNVQKNYKINTSIVFLDSQGGSVEEALRIGELMRENLSSVWVMQGKRCFSACTIIWAGGADRTLYGNAKLGFHRLTLGGKEVDVTKSKSRTDIANQKVTAFFREVGFPTLLIDKMNETPPSDLYIVDSGWLFDHELDKAVAYQPAFLDVVEKHCGVDPTMTAYKQGRRQTPSENDRYTEWIKCAEGVKDTNRKLVVKAYEKGYKDEERRKRR